MVMPNLPEVIAAAFGRAAIIESNLEDLLVSLRVNARNGRNATIRTYDGITDRQVAYAAPTTWCQNFSIQRLRLPSAGSPSNQNITVISDGTAQILFLFWRQNARIDVLLQTEHATGTFPHCERRRGYDRRNLTRKA
jgi:hypothetical protein